MVFMPFKSFEIRQKYYKLEVRLYKMKKDNNFFYVVALILLSILFLIFLGILKENIQEKKSDKEFCFNSSNVDNGSIGFRWSEGRVKKTFIKTPYWELINFDIPQDRLHKINGVNFTIFLNLTENLSYEYYVLDENLCILDIYNKSSINLAEIYNKCIISSDIQTLNNQETFLKDFPKKCKLRDYPNKNESQLDYNLFPAKI